MSHPKLLCMVIMVVRSLEVGQLHYSPTYSVIIGSNRGFRPDPNETTGSIYDKYPWGTFPGPMGT